MQIAFYRSSGPFAWLIRLLTWDWWGGQRFADVPAHVAVRLGDRLYEAVVTGVQARPWGSHPDDLNCRLIDAPLGPFWGEARAGLWLDAQVGRPYDWGALLCGWPDLTGRRYDCYRLAVGALLTAGVPVPFAGVCESPNYLMRWMQAQKQ